jgi:hypothetical protein
MNIQLKIKQMYLDWNYTSTVTHQPGDAMTWHGNWSSADGKTEPVLSADRKKKKKYAERKARYKNWINTIFFLKPEPAAYNVALFNDPDHATTTVYPPASATPSKTVGSFFRKLFRNRMFYYVTAACLFGIVISSFGCHPQQLAPDDYLRWVESESNGLHLKHTVNGITFRLQYKPHLYILLKQHQGHIPDVQNELQQLAGLQYYDFSVSSSSGETLLEGGDPDDQKSDSQVEYFTSNIKRNICLVENGDTLPCELSYFERNYGAAEGNLLVLGFRENSPASGPADRTFIYHDDVFNSGQVKLVLQGSAIASVPQPRLN